MAYYIFLKSLRILEEFRKNPHVKIPPKSPSTNFPSLGKFKIEILIQKSFFFTFGPATLLGPAGLPLPRPRPADRNQLFSAQTASPLGPAGQPAPVLAYFAKYVLFFDSRLPSSAPSLSPLTDAWTPHVGFIFPTAPADPGRATASCATRSAHRDTVEPLPPRPHHSSP
jgi:hypothetical protein